MRGEGERSGASTIAYQHSELKGSQGPPQMALLTIHCNGREGLGCQELSQDDTKVGTGVFRWTPIGTIRVEDLVGLHLQWQHLEGSGSSSGVMMMIMMTRRWKGLGG